MNIEIREILRNCNCNYPSAFHCGTYEEMKDEYCDIPKGEMVLDVGGTYYCRVCGARKLSHLKIEIDEAIAQAEALGWNLTEKTND